MSAAPLSPRGSSTCRGCGSDHLQSVLDLGSQPLANQLLPTSDTPDPAYPLHLKICPACGLGQVGEFVSPWDIFHDYPYLSSTSTSRLGHIARYVDQMHAELNLRAGDLVIEVASNDGHLLQQFRSKGIAVLGVEPAANVAQIAISAGVPTKCAFFGLETAKVVHSEHGTPRLIAANNVLAHVPDLDDFVSGLAELCGRETVITIENPSFVQLLTQAQFDTIYHEHFSYLTAHSVRVVARRHGLELVRVEQLATHGGSNRYHLQRTAAPVDPSVDATLEREEQAGLLSPAVWERFAKRSIRAIDGLRQWLTEQRQAGRVTAGYGAAAKGNTFLNAAGANGGDLCFVVDGSPTKQGRFLPGSRIPVVAPSELPSRSVDDVLIIPWNIAQELHATVEVLSPRSRIWIALPEMKQLR